jgi:SRSO17 transposase
MACPIEPYDEAAVSAAGAATHSKDLLDSLPRADQRRWAEVFIRGLLTVRGRKTVKKISDQVAGGGAEQCLQQFVNQSTWRWDTVRRDLALQLTGALEPRTWVLREVVMPKNGCHSVGVGRQFAHSERRVLNCQLGIAVFLAGDDWSCPVNWRLCLPPSWDHDKERRKKAHVPDEERSLPRWQHVLDAIDEMVIDWGLPPAPVVADMSQEPHLDPLLRGLEERHLRYALRVGVNRPAIMVGSGDAVPRTLSFGQVIAKSIAMNTTAVNRWHLPADRPGRPQLIAARLPAAAMGLSPRPLPARGRPPYLHECPAPRWTPPRHVVAEWSQVRKAPLAAWLTSFDPHRLPSMPEEIKRHDRTGADLYQLYDGLGLQHFEGRSYPGWHHYVTLVSIASACQQLSRYACQPRW